MATDLHHHHRHPQWQLLTQHRHREVAQVPPFPGHRRTSAGQAPARSLPLERSLHRLGEEGVAGHLEHHHRALAQAPQGTVALWDMMEGGREREREREREGREHNTIKAIGKISCTPKYMYLAELIPHHHTLVAQALLDTPLDTALAPVPVLARVPVLVLVPELARVVQGVEPWASSLVDVQGRGEVVLELSPRIRPSLLEQQSQRLSALVPYVSGSPASRAQVERPPHPLAASSDFAGGGGGEGGGGGREYSHNVRHGFETLDSCIGIP